MYNVKEDSNLIHSHIDSVLLAQFVEKPAIPAKRVTQEYTGLHWDFQFCSTDVYLSLYHQHHTVLITVALKKVLKLGSVSFSAFCSFPIVFWMFWVTCNYICILNQFTSFYKDIMWMRFWRDFTKTVPNLEYQHLNIVSQPMNIGIFHLFLFLSFFQYVI